MFLLELLNLALEVTHVDVKAIHTSLFLLFFDDSKTALHLPSLLHVSEDKFTWLLLAARSKIVKFLCCT